MGKTVVKILYLILFLLGIPLFSICQDISVGIQGIVNFPKNTYDAGTQNWDIAQDSKGFMYFANNDGLLQFDGLSWTTLEVSPNSPLRSVLVDSNNNVYVGLINDFGVIIHNQPNKPYFKSLRYLLLDNVGDFDDIWKIYEINEGIVFQCFDFVFLLKDEEIEIIRPTQRFRFSYQLNDALILHEPGVGLFQYKNGNREFLRWSEPLKDKTINCILEYGSNELLIGTIGDGIYLVSGDKVEEWNVPVNDWLKTNRLFSAAKVLDNYFAFGSILNGVIITDNNGNIIQQIGRKEGLQNNTVLDLFSDNDQNLWLALDNGIDYIEINSPISYITKAQDIGTGYCSIIFDGNLYLGTNQGLFVRPYSVESNNLPFELVTNTAGQVWSLAEFDGQLICGHHNGTYLVRGSNAIKISDQEGAWKYIQLKEHPEYLLGGHYSGLVLLKKGGQGWEFFKKLDGFNESSRYLYEDTPGDIWISHGGRGIFRVQLNNESIEINEFRLFKESDGLPSIEGNIIFKLNERLYVSTKNKIYTYNKSTDSFEYEQEVNDLLNVEGRIKTLKQDDVGNIWYIAGKDAGVFRINEDQSYTQITSPFKIISGEFVNEFESIYPYNEDNLLMGIYNGFAHYSARFSKSYTKPFQSVITFVEAPYIDSTFYFNSSAANNVVALPFRKNALRIHYSAPFFENLDGMRYSHFLDNYSENWSDWTNESYKDFTNLEEGEYSFKVKAKNIYGVESNIAEFNFKILPPWHRTTLAYFIYVLLIITVIYFIIRFGYRRIELSKRREKQKHELEIKRREEEFQRQSLITDKEIIRLRNEKLRADKVHRDKELANQTMNIIQKNKLLNNLNEELKHIQKSTNDSALSTKLAIIKKRITRELDDKQQHKLFETYFEDVHADFFKKLKEEYPQLTPKDLRLCAYIRMNISSKEIAALLNISYRGVEIHRYRLRKKLDLPRETNLSTFLLGI